MRSSWQMLRGATARKGYVALIDQAIVSGTNFAIGILLARYCLPEEYGAYVLAFTTLLLLTGLSGALIADPMTVLGSPRQGTVFADYATSLLICQSAIAVVWAASVYGAAFVLSRWSNLPTLGSVLYGLAAAIIFLQSREFFRRLFFAQLRPAAVLVNDIIYCSAVIGGIFLLKHLGIAQSRNVFFVMGSVGFIACAAALFQARGVLARPSLRRIVPSIRENWSLGRWNLAISMSHFGFSRASTYVLAGYIGTAASARMAAARNILAPLQIMIFALTNVAAPRAAIAFKREGRPQMNRFLGRAALLLITISGVYCLGAALMPNLLLKLFYGKRYLGEGNVVRLWAAIYFVTALNFAPGTAIKSMRRPDIVFAITFAAAAVALALCFALVPGMHVTGAMLAQLCAVTIAAMASAFAFFKKGIEDRPVIRETLTNSADKTP